MEKKLGDVYDKISEETAELNTVAQECLSGIRTVKAFSREKHEFKKFGRHNRRFYNLNMEQSRIVAGYQPAISFFGDILLLAIIVFGGLMVIKGDMTLGDLGAFSEYANNVIWPMQIVGWLSNDLASAFASWKKIKKVAASTPQIIQSEDTVSPEKIVGNLRFEHVGFTLDGHELLRDINLEIRPGQTLGIMGMTGSGKTTLVNLIERFYDVTQGAILLDGIDIRSLPLEELRANVSVVMQDVFLFSDSVTENIKTGKRCSLTPDTVEWAAEKAGAAKFIGRLGNGYDTIIGERGVGLSGGQKQRISIARAIAKKAPILILDDAASALDMETEQLVQKNLKDIGTAKILISHRISAVRSADEIIVLNNQEIAERGTHEELMAKKGLYYRTWCVQYENRKEETPCQ